MAKVNGQMTGYNGTVGQITYVTTGGETVARQKPSSVRNPQTVAQTAQRVIAKGSINRVPTGVLSNSGYKAMLTFYLSAIQNTLLLPYSLEFKWLILYLTQWFSVFFHWCPLKMSHTPNMFSELLIF